jgi:hypothetical protein
VIHRVSDDAEIQVFVSAKAKQYRIHRVSDDAEIKSNLSIIVVSTYDPALVRVNTFA